MQFSTCIIGGIFIMRTEDDRRMKSRIPYKQRRSRVWPKFRSDYRHNMTTDPVLVVDIQRGVIFDDLARLLDRPKPWYGKREEPDTE